MSGNKYLSNSAGRIQEVVSNQSSAGAGDAGKIPALDSTGRLDATMMPVGIGADIVIMTTSEDLTSGSFVNIWLNGGVATARKADATTSGKEADGFVLTGTTSGGNATVYFAGQNTQLSTLTIGSRYYLATTAGATTATAPSATGNVVQYLGRAVSATSIAFDTQAAVILA